MVRGEQERLNCHQCLRQALAKTKGGRAEKSYKGVAEVPNYKFGVMEVQSFWVFALKNVHVKGSGERHIPEIHYLPKPQCLLGSKESSQGKHILQAFDADCFFVYHTQTFWKMRNFI